MPAPIKVSFQVAGEKELLKAFDTIEKRVQALAKAEEKAARASESSAKSRVRAARSEAAGSGGGYRSPGVNGQSYREVEREAKAHAQRMDSIGRQLTNAAKRESASRVAAIRKAVNDEIRENRRAEMARAKSRMAFLGGAAGAVGRGVRGTAGSVAGVAGGLGVTAGGYAISNALMSAMSLEQQAALLAGSAKKDGAAPDPTKLAGDARRVALSTGFKAEDVMGAMGTVAARAGGSRGLEAFRTDIDDVSKTAKAAGVSMEDLGGVYAAALNAGVAPGKEMQQLMRDFVEQGRAGAVEFSDLASELARLGGAGNKFGSGADMLRKVGGWAQLAVESKVSPEESRTAVVDMLREFTMAEKIKGMTGMGVTVTKGGKLNDPAEIMASLISGIEGGKKLGKYGGTSDAAKLGAYGYMFTGSSNDLALGLRDTFLKAGGGDAGKAAVLARIREAEKPGGKTYGSAERDTDYARVMGTTTEQVNLAMEKFKVEISKMLPEFARMLPEVLKVTQGFAKLAVWVSKNPLEGLGALLAYKIGTELAAAAIPSLFQKAISAASTASYGGTGVGTIGGSKALGGIAAGLAITAAAVTITAAGVEIIDKASAAGEKSGKEVFASSIEAQNLLAKGARRELSAEEKASLSKHGATLKTYSERSQFGALGEVAGGMKATDMLDPMMLYNKATQFFRESAKESQGVSAEEAAKQAERINAMLASAAKASETIADNLNKGAGSSRDGKPPARPGGP